MQEIQVKDKTFHKFIDQEVIQDAVQKIAGLMIEDLADKRPIFVVVLNGSFMFVSDLFKLVNFDAKITFVKLSSYQGMTSGESLKKLIGLNENVTGRTVVILEDVIDTGNTIVALKKMFEELSPTEIKFAALLFKPDVYDKDINIDYKGIEIGKDFVIGYGLDYDGYGRNLPHIYRLNN